MSKEKSEKPPSDSSASEEDDAISDPNTPLNVEPISSYHPRLYPYSDPSSITAGIDPQTQAFIKSQGPTDFSSVLGLQNQNQNQNQSISPELDLETQLIISAIENPNQTGIQESSEFRRQIEAYKMIENRNQNWHGVQESSNVRRRLDLSEAEARILKNSSPVSLPAAKKQKVIVPTPIRRQSSEERNLERALQISMEEKFGKQGRRTSGTEIREALAPEFHETRTAGAGTQSLEQSEIDRGAQEWINLELEEKEYELRVVQESIEMLKQEQKGASGIVILESSVPESHETRTAGTQTSEQSETDWEVQEWISQELEEKYYELRAIQESIEMLKKQQKGASGIREPVFLPALKKQRIGQSSEERDFELALQISMEEMLGKQGRRDSGIVIRESPAPEFTETREIGRPESIKGKEKVKEVEKKEEEESPFLLCPSTTEEEDDYNTLKFLVAFRRADGSHLPWSEISFSDFIEKMLPNCPSITKPRCDIKVWKLFDKFIELRARFDGVERQEGRQYEMFHMGRFVWNWEGATSSKNSNAGPNTHGSDPTDGDPGSNVQQGSDAGNGADPAAPNVDPEAVNVDPENGADPNPRGNVQQGGNAGMEDPEQNVGDPEAVNVDPENAGDPNPNPRGNVQQGGNAGMEDPGQNVGDPEALVDPENGAKRYVYRLMYIDNTGKLKPVDD